jgi:hypothetical protein
MSVYLLTGEATGSAADLHRALARALACQDVTPGAASVLITLTQDAERAMADATEFADAQPDGDPDRGVVILLPPAATAAWPDVRYGATLWAFVRYAALAWAPRRVRINLISLGIDLVQPWSKPRGALQPVPDQDVIAAIRAIRGWPCMTGQSICLGA